MSYAIRSGYAAAKSFTNGKGYDALWKESFLSELKTSDRLRNLFEKAKDRDIGKLLLKFGNAGPAESNSAEVEFGDIKRIMLSRKINTILLLASLLPKCPVLKLLSK